ncbi:MAG: hypothetical protein ACI814_004961 [Mariniblastus sp.]
MTAPCSTIGLNQFAESARAVDFAALSLRSSNEFYSANCPGWCENFGGLGLIAIRLNQQFVLHQKQPSKIAIKTTGPCGLGFGRGTKVEFSCLENHWCLEEESQTGGILEALRWWLGRSRGIVDLSSFVAGVRHGPVAPVLDPRLRQRLL